MDFFTYKDGELHCEDVSVERVAQEVGTPCYAYSERTITEHYDRLTKAFEKLDPLICFSIKSCANLSILRVLAERGAGMDLVSGGELHRAQLAGVDPQKCVYAGVGKTETEIRESLDANVGWLNIESEQEFEAVSRVASSMKKKIKAALRVNPDVDPKTHRYTTTGKKETKFGVDIERARKFFQTYGKDKSCHVRGLHMHLGSPIYSPDPYASALAKMLDLMDELKSDGHEIEMIDLGGGFGADYETAQTPVASEYAHHIVPLLEDRVRDGLKVILEPGRTIIANAGILLIRVLYVKKSGEKSFVICDGGMNVLLRPSHYGSFHFIWPTKVPAEFVPMQRSAILDLPGLNQVDIVGPICESGDFLATDRRIPPVKSGDLLAVFTAGAYGMVMASRYNSMPFPAEMLVNGDKVHLIRRREKYDDLVEHERNLKS